MVARRRAPKNPKISCKPSFPTMSSSAVPVFHLPHSILVSQITQCLKRDTPPFHGWSNTYSMATTTAHLPFLEEFQPLLASRCPPLPIVDMSSHPQ